jgi:hypothetical protein
MQDGDFVGKSARSPSSSSHTPAFRRLDPLVDDLPGPTSAPPCVVDALPQIGGKQRQEPPERLKPSRFGVCNLLPSQGLRIRDPGLRRVWKMPTVSKLVRARYTDVDRTECSTRKTLSFTVRT